MNQSAGMFIYFSELINTDVIDREEAYVGKLYDIIVVETDIFPKAIYLIVYNGFIRHRYVVIPWNLVKEKDAQSIHIDVLLKDLHFDALPTAREELSLRRDILDQQVVDIHNHNVIRVNDVHFIAAGQDLMVAHVDIGARGFVRRLGLEKVVDAVVRLFNKDFSYLRKEQFIPWKNIQPLSINPVSKTIKIDVSRRKLNEIHPVDFSEIMLDLDHKERLAIFRILDLETKIAIFSLLQFPQQKSLLDHFSDKEALEIISRMPTDEAADFLDELPKESVNKLLAVMETPKAKKLSTLLGYESESAGGLMTTEFFAFPQQMTVGDALEMVKMDKTKPESIQYMYITDDRGFLLGATNLRRLITLDPNENILKAKFRKNISVYPDSSLKEVAILMDKYKINVLPVVNDEKIIQGIITVDDTLDQLITIAWRRWRTKNPTI